MVVAKRPLTHDLTDQASFFVRLSAGYLAGFRPFIGHPFGITQRRVSLDVSNMI
jgi:hypothetical protein